MMLIFNHGRVGIVIIVRIVIVDIMTMFLLRWNRTAHATQAVAGERA